jgi:acetone carboxylase gamma subunit
VKDTSAPKYSKKVIRDLVDRKLSWTVLKQIMSSPKDSDRFDKYVEVLQEKVPWKEKILLPIGEHLFIVCKEGKPIVKAACGHEFGDYRENWKLKALINVRDTEEKLKEIFPGLGEYDTSIAEVREYYCPGCGTLLDVASMARGYPILFEFLPDIEAFYRKWLGRPLPCGTGEVDGVQDRSAELLRSWAKEIEKRKANP